MSPPSSLLQSLFGLSPASPKLTDILKFLNNATPVPAPEVKSYSDAVYLNYYTLGLSLLFAPQNGYKPKAGLSYNDIDMERLALDSLDIYNTPNSKDGEMPTKLRGEPVYSTFPSIPLVLRLASDVHKDGNQVDRPENVSVTGELTGKELVNVLGEPDRKGGGAGPSSGSIGIWCEWSKDGIMIEFGGDEARGPGAWERGKDAVWRIVTLFPPKGR